MARQYSRMKGGAGKVAIAPGHVKGRKRGYDHIHALDAAGERLPGHFFYGTVAALLFALDIVPDHSSEIPNGSAATTLSPEASGPSAEA
jgi:hypothetical protein